MLETPIPHTPLLQKSPSRIQRFWKFVNSPITLWILSSVVITLLTGYYNMQAQERANQELIAKYDVEIATRFEALEREITNAEAGTGNIYYAITRVLYTVDSNTDYAFIEFKDRTVATLLFEESYLVPDEERGNILAARKAILQLNDLFTTLASNYQNVTGQSLNSPCTGCNPVDVDAAKTDAINEVKQFLKQNDSTLHHWLHDPIA